MCEFSARLLRVGGLPRKLQWAELRTWFLQSRMSLGLWQPTSESLWSAAPSPQFPSKWIAKPWEPGLRQRGRGIRSIHVPWGDPTGKCRGPVPPANLLVQGGQNPQIEVLLSLTLLPHQPGEQIAKNLWKSQLLLGGEFWQLCSVNGIKMNWYPHSPSKMWLSWGTDGFHVCAVMGDSKMGPQCWFESWAATEMH